MNYQEALDIIKMNLERKKIKIEKQCSHLEIEGVSLDITSTTSFTFRKDWTIGNIRLKTSNCDINYKHKRKRIMRFNIVSGNYESLITKIKKLQLENVEILKQVESDKERKQSNYEKAKKMFKDYDFKEIYNGLEIETPYFCINIYPDSNIAKINTGFDLGYNYNKIKELLTKLGVRRENNE